MSENIKINFLSRFLMGRHKQTVEVYEEIIEKQTKPDWQIHHNLGKS